MFIRLASPDPLSVGYPLVAPGAVLVALDVSVEEAALRALEARARLAEITRARSEHLLESGSIPREHVDPAHRQKDEGVAREALRRLGSRGRMSGVPPLDGARVAC
jgi:hypothetical protein